MTTDTMFSNRITRAVDAAEAKLVDLPADTLAKLDDASTLPPGDWAALGPMPTRMHMDGVVDLYEANALHAIHGDFNDGATIAQRMVFIQVVHEYMGGRR